MIYQNLDDFSKNILKNKRIIGLDVGRKTIGVALSDRDKNIATAKFIIARKSNVKDTEILKNYINENDVGAIVVGLPLNSCGETTEACSYINSFIQKLDKEVDLAIFFNDEFLTSFDAEDILMDKMGFGIKKTKTLVDKVAAAVILQEVLNLIKINSIQKDL